MYRRILLVAVALMIALAGCSGGPGAATNPSETTDGAPDDGTTSEQVLDSSSGGGQAGTVQFYISDQANAIGDFEHLNATVTEVQFHYAGATNDTDDAETTAQPETTDAPETTTAMTTDSPETTTVVMTAEPEGQSEAKGTDKQAEKEGEDDADEKEDDENESEDDGDDVDESEDDEKGQAGWITKDIDDTTVDLTELQGANATLLENMSMPAGKYTQVRLVVSEVNGTLNDGSDQRVKLPSGRLKLNKPFTLAANDTVDFVFDVTVHEAGKSGKYILKPVAGESGTDQEIDRVDAKADKERGEDKDN